MDEMQIKSSFTKAIIVKVLTKLIKSKLGIDANIGLGDIFVKIDDATAFVSLSLTASTDKNELSKAVFKFM